jgi:hypothetical protein
MKKKSLILFIIVFSILPTFGQNLKDSISIGREFGCNIFYQNYKTLKINKLVKTVKHNELAFKEVKSARNSYYLSCVIGAVGGNILGASLGYAYFTKEFDFLSTGLGVGIIGISIAYLHRYNIKSKNAIEIFNEEIRTNSTD